MHLKSAPLAAAILAGLLFAAAPRAAAQQSAISTAQSANTTAELQKPLKAPPAAGQVPMLYEGELEDLGPQYVLQPHEQPKYFLFNMDLQLYHTNNAALSPANKVSSDVSVYSVQLAVQNPAAQLGNWQVQAQAGVRYQSYWYGIFSGRNANTAPPPAFSPIKDLDFQIFSPYGQVSFKNDPWYAALGIRYAAFNSDNAVSNENFYQEWVPSGTLGYTLNLSSNRILQFQYDGDFRGTNTDEKGLHPTGWEDRTDQSFSIIHSWIIGQNWVVQPSYRIMWSKYTNPGRNRADVYNTVSLMVAYYFNDWASARAFTSYEFRQSTEFGNDYQNWNLGAGFSINVNF